MWFCVIMGVVSFLIAAGCLFFGAFDAFPEGDLAWGYVLATVVFVSIGVALIYFGVRGPSIPGSRDDE